jgi:hypothetical protein
MSKGNNSVYNVLSFSKIRRKSHFVSGYNEIFKRSQVRRLANADWFKNGITET